MLRAPQSCPLITTAVGDCRYQIDDGALSPPDADDQ